MYENKLILLSTASLLGLENEITFFRKQTVVLH